MKVKVKYTDNAHFVVFETSALKVVFNKKDLSISFINNKNDTLSKAINYTKSYGAAAGIDFESDGREAFYGGGSKAIDLDKRGQVLENYNQAHFDYKFGQTDMNIAIPLLVSSRKYGIYLDNPAKSTFDVCKTDPKLVSYRTVAGLISFFFIAAPDLDGVIAGYTHLTGRQPLPPRWALGYISSRYGYKSEREIDSVVSKTQRAGIPLDGVVFDLFWYKSDSLMGNHNWDRDSFPDPKRMLTTLSKKGVKVVPISETYITEKSENFKLARDRHLLTPDLASKPEPHIFQDFWAGPAGLLDIFKPESQQLYWSFYRARIREGVSGWWFDLGEPEASTDSLRFAAGPDNKVHNLYPLVWIKTAFDGYRRDFPQSRIFILPRSGYAGMQRYSTFPWSGDNDRSFEGLKAQIPVILNMGLSGVGYMHSDAGGFTGGGEARIDPELYSRWLEFAAFTPVMRTHADATNYSPEPIFWDDETRLRVTQYIKLRYRLLPYNYTLAYKNTMTGRPLMLPVNYFDGDNVNLNNINDEYLWGEQILVAPVIVKGQVQKKVLFPKGEWIGFNDDKSYEDSATVSAPIDSLPLFVKAGSIIPMISPVTNTGQYDGGSLLLKYFMGADVGSVKSTWFFDNGEDPHSLKDMRYDLITFTTSGKGVLHNIEIAPQHLMLKRKTFKLIIPGKQIKAVSFSKPTPFSVVTDRAGNRSEVDFEWKGAQVMMHVVTQ